MVFLHDILFEFLKVKKKLSHFISVLLFESTTCNGQTNSNVNMLYQEIAKHERYKMLYKPSTESKENAHDLTTPCVRIALQKL